MLIYSLEYLNSTDFNKPLLSKLAFQEMTTTKITKIANR